MGSSINRENIDDYYKKINNKIDHYFDSDVSASALQKYFSKDYGLNKFIKREKLEEIKGIERIIKDVVEDRVASEESVMTFEQFGGKQEGINITFGINQDIEKQIADIYRVSLGHIDSDSNKIKLKGVKREQELYVFTSENLKDIRINISNNMFNLFVKNKLNINYSPLNININLDKKVIDKEEFIYGIYSNIITDMKLIEEVLYGQTGDRYEHKDINEDITIFEKK